MMTARFPRSTVPVAHLCAVLVLIAAGCSYSSSAGHIMTGVAPNSYRYAVVGAGSVAVAEIARELVDKGYVVLRKEASDRLPYLDVPSGAVLFVTCTYLGHTASDALGSTGANVTCEAIDYASNTPVYRGRGKHTGMTQVADVKGAARNALRSFPETGREGTVSMIADFPAQSPSAGGQLNRPGTAKITTGTGFFVDSLGHVVTNAHVVDSCHTITAAGERLRVLRLDRRNDLALLVHPTPSAALPLRSGKAVRPGDEVVVIGFPLSGILASQPSVTTGTVSSLAGIEDDSRFIQLTAPVQPGNSGGPVMDRGGSVIGVVVAKLDAIAVARITGDVPQNVNFAVSAGTLKNFGSSRV